MVKERLDLLYDEYNRPEYIYPDPLAFLHDYQDVRDREVVGLLASCLAYGRVEMIMSTIARVLQPMGSRPFEWICSVEEGGIRELTQGFVYRFARESHLAALLLGIRRVIQKFASLEACFSLGLTRGRFQNPVLAGLAHLYECLDPEKKAGHLLADPLKKSACKRGCLFLRWMIRRDLVDPGGWDPVLARYLIVPLDTHMYAVGHLLGFTYRKSQDMKTAMEITEGFRKMVVDDPVKYDFCLTRFGIRRELGIKTLEEKLCLDTLKKQNINERF